MLLTFNPAFMAACDPLDVHFAIKTRHLVWDSKCFLFFFHFLVGRLGFYFHETIIEKSRPPTSLIVLFNAAGLLYVWLGVLRQNFNHVRWLSKFACLLFMAYKEHMQKDRAGNTAEPAYSCARSRLSSPHCPQKISNTITTGMSHCCTSWYFFLNNHDGG